MTEARFVRLVFERLPQDERRRRSSAFLETAQREERRNHRGRIPGECLTRR